MSIQERIESTGAGRALISAFIAATLFGMLVWNAPDSHLKRDVLPPVRAFMPTLGLDQNWAVFAPDPRRQVLEIEARLEYADGTAETWRVPNANAIVGSFEEYRCRLRLRARDRPLPAVPPRRVIASNAAEGSAQRRCAHGGAQLVVQPAVWCDEGGAGELDVPVADEAGGHHAT